MTAASEVDGLAEAAVVGKLGAPPRPGQYPLADPGPGQALIRVGAAALNPIDLLISAGRHPVGAPPVPHVPGVEGVGRVVRGSTLPAGQRVRFLVQGGFARGTLARYAVVGEDACVPVPDGLDDVTAAAIGVVGVSALAALRDRARLQPGERVLVLGATGAFGAMFVQVAKVLGAGRVVAAGRNPEALATLPGIGADAVLALPDQVDDRSPTWLAEAAGERFDVVVDPLWGAYAAAAVLGLADGGRLLNVGQAAGPVASIAAGALRHSAGSVLGFSGTALAPAEIGAAYQQVARYVVDGRIVVHTAAYPFDEIGSAWRAQATSAGGRKIVLTC
jgi:NADPH:quinone reductase-like Zn-dependent oxidoreductase